MGKKLFVSSVVGKPALKKKNSTLVRVSQAQLNNRLRKQKFTHSEESRDPEIDFSDIAELRDSDLKRAVRMGPGRPPLGAQARKLISIKIDLELLRQLKSEAAKKGKGYQTLIHEVLETYVKRSA